MKLRHHYYILGSLIGINLLGYLFYPEIVRLPYARGRTLLLIATSLAPPVYALFVLSKLNSILYKILFLICVVLAIIVRTLLPPSRLLYQRRYVVPLAQDATFQEYTEKLREYLIKRKPGGSGPVSAVFLSTKPITYSALGELAKLFGKGRLLVVHAEQSEEWRVFHISTRDRMIPVNLNMYIIHYGREMLDFDSAKDSLWINDFTLFTSREIQWGRWGHPESAD